ncbi:NUDIX domain-containing protein [Barnesiella sp. WM24]|uniref:NUDIX hydrolase n=1 Tax=Barnesiella sp. WM24 TaxID=2558278 RepID=UPI0010721325|nr:NUDIX domain-containing protein [Barnesiella sp. WM24]MDE6113973.1 NUDIX domain-containing protein [Muribaculum sp.]TFU92668.1 NUDIX domain-containing protein [Barnesiella sp. WM24]
MNKEEIFPLVNSDGEVVGKATRSECHSGSMLMHPVVHLHVMKKGGWLYLQQRSMSKDIQPGKWDTAVGGHVDFGESVEDALMREAREELGLSGFTPVSLAPYVFRSSRECELINPYYVYVDDDVELTPDPGEISAGRFWHVEEIVRNLHNNVFTPNFEEEFESRIKQYLK